MQDKTQRGDFMTYPTDKLLAVIDSPKDVAAALDDLQAAGVGRDEVTVSVGEAEARRLDGSGERHGFKGRLLRALQQGAGDVEVKHFKRYEQELLDGHYLVEVPAKDGERRGRVHQILKTHGAHFINYYGSWAVEDLEP